MSLTYVYKHTNNVSDIQQLQCSQQREIIDINIIKLIILKSHALNMLKNIFLKLKYLRNN